MIKKIFEESYQEYLKYMTDHIDDFWHHYSFLRRRNQCESFINVINNNFDFEKLIIVETGATQNLRDGGFGLFLGIAANKTSGKMISIDIQEDLLIKSKHLFNTAIPELNYEIYNENSLNFLNNLNVPPNLVHLDSWDLNLKSPLPSSLHGFREFMAIENKMPSGSIIIIDDNYIKGTKIEWFYPDGNMEWLSIDYPMIGKGSNVYHYVLNGESNWKLIGEHYNIHDNIKVIIQKK